MDLTALQIFSSNPRGWKSKSLSEDDIDRYLNILDSSDLEITVIHTKYLINISTPDEEIYEKSRRLLLEEMETAKTLNMDYVVTHLGSHKGEGIDFGLERVKSALEWLLDEIDLSDSDTQLLLENSAGAGNLVGNEMGDLSWLMKNLNNDNLALCIDSAHAYGTGYDVGTREGMDRVFEELNLEPQIIKLLHLNDSKVELGSHKDRHEHLGMGYIGEEGLRNFLNDERISGLPVIMETPVDDKGDDEYNKKVFLKLVSQ